MARSTRIRLVGGPRALDGTVWPQPPAPDDRGEARFLVAVHGSRCCPLDELVAQCIDRAMAEQLAHQWQVAAYSPSGRARRLRPRLYRFETVLTLEAHRHPRQGWSLRPGPRWVVAATAATAATTPGAEPLPETWSRLEAGVDRAAARFRTVADLVPEGPLADRALGAITAVDTCVADAARLCAVGATVTPDWQPGRADDEGAALVARVTALIGTIDEATRELVQLHLELGEAAWPAETLALLGEAVAELSAGLDDDPVGDYQRGDQDDERNNRDSH